MSGKLKKVISASRRTDLPNFHYNWLQEVLKAGEVTLPNPRFKEKTFTVDLRPETVHSLVLWSKDFNNVLEDPMYLENYNLYFQYTINNYSKVLEPNVPEYKQTINTLAVLLKRYKSSQFNIRFDPVVISGKGEMYPTVKKGTARLQAFERLCRDLASLGMFDCRITTSYIDLYGHVKTRLANIKLDVVQLNDELKRQFFGRMVEIAHKYGLSLYSCASPELIKVEGLKLGRCIDGELLEKLFGGKVSKAADTGQRAACRCTKSSDIGSYEQICGHGCIYCYRQSHC